MSIDRDMGCLKDAWISRTWVDIGPLLALIWVAPGSGSGMNKHIAMVSNPAGDWKKKGVGGLKLEDWHRDKQ
jgi:hypothetical protein